jgi:hypothetical protein
MQTLCVLHRHNRRGEGSWYPERILTAPQAPPRDRPAARRPGRSRPDDGPGIDTLA